MNTIDIRPADRVATVREYYLQRKMREVAQLNAAGADIISLGIGGPDMPPPQAAIDTLCAQARRPDTHGYQLGSGLPEMRRAFAHWYGERFGVSLDADSEIMPLIGSKEGIVHVSLTFLNPGDGVLLPNPGYPTYTSVSRLVGADIRYYDLREDCGWTPDFEALEHADLSGVKIMWTNYPNMPTGAPASRELFERLIDFGRRHNILVINDNPYSFILNDNPLSILSVPGAKDIAIEMNSLSKSHNMAGWRIGMLAAKAEYVSWIRRVKSNVDSGQFAPMMSAVADALAVGDEWYAELNATYAERRAIVDRIVTALGCTFDPTQRGMFVWARIPEAEPSAEAMADRILEQARVFITPGSIFGSNGDRYIRLSLCAKPHNLRRALDRIQQINQR